MRSMAAGEFKAKCLSLMDEVQAKREPVTITKHGRPIVKMVPLDEADNPLAAFRYPGKVEIVGDIMAPLYTDAEYEEFFEASAAQLN